MYEGIWKKLMIDMDCRMLVWLIVYLSRREEGWLYIQEAYAQAI